MMNKATSRIFFNAAVSHSVPRGEDTPTISDVWNMCDDYKVGLGELLGANERYVYVTKVLGFSEHQGVVAALYYLGRNASVGINLGDNDYE